MIELNYRYRFDPQGLQDAERAGLKSAVQSWLNKYRSSDLQLL
ncbi:hypothetical protein [Trichormus azollae]